MIEMRKEMNEKFDRIYSESEEPKIVRKLIK